MGKEANVALRVSLNKLDEAIKAAEDSVLKSRRHACIGGVGAHQLKKGELQLVMMF